MHSPSHFFIHSTSQFVDSSSHFRSLTRSFCILSPGYFSSIRLVVSIYSSDHFRPFSWTKQVIFVYSIRSFFSIHQLIFLHLSGHPLISIHQSPGRCLIKDHTGNFCQQGRSAFPLHRSPINGPAACATLIPMANTGRRRDSQPWPTDRGAY